MENAGAWAVEVEVVPSNITKILTNNTELVVTSIGAGKADIQFLFAQDILGDGDNFPRHSKQYSDFKSFREQATLQRISAFKDYISDVDSGVFPAESNLIKANISVETHLIGMIGDKDG